MYIYIYDKKKQASHKCLRCFILTLTVPQSVKKKQNGIALPLKSKQSQVSEYIFHVDQYQI